MRGRAEGGVGGRSGHRLGRCGLAPERPLFRTPASQHQQQVLQAVERAKQVTVGELNSLIGVSHPGPCPGGGGDPTPGPAGAKAGDAGRPGCPGDVRRAPAAGPCAQCPGVSGRGCRRAPPAPGPPSLLSSSSSSSRCRITPPLCPSPLALRGWWAAVPRGCWPCPERWPRRPSWPLPPRRTAQAWRPRAPEVSGQCGVARAGRCWQAALLRALSSAQYEGVNEGNPRAPLLPAGRVSLGEFLTLPGRVSNGSEEGMIHPLQGCWEEKGDSELGRGIYKLWRAVPHPSPWETTPSLTLFSFSLPPSPPTRQWSEPRAG